MMNLTPELIAKAKAAKSAEELLELAKANDVELTAEEAKICFEQLHTSGAVSDDELEAVAGGGICDFFENFFRLRGKPETDDCAHCADMPTAIALPQKPDSLTVDSSVKPLPFDSLPSDSTGKNKIKFL